MVRSLFPQRGFSLVEVLVVAAVVGVLAGTGLPALHHAKVNRQADAAAAQLRTDLQHARSIAVAESRLVSVSFVETSRGSCYVAYTGPRGSCTCADESAPHCSDPASQVKASHFEPASRLHIRSESRTLSFDSTHGTATPTATVRILAEGTDERRVIVSLSGRARTCTLGRASIGAPAC